MAMRPPSLLLFALAVGTPLAARGEVCAEDLIVSGEPEALTELEQGLARLRVSYAEEPSCEAPQVHIAGEEGAYEVVFTAVDGAREAREFRAMAVVATWVASRVSSDLTVGLFVLPELPAIAPETPAEVPLKALPVQTTLYAGVGLDDLGQMWTDLSLSVCWRTRGACVGLTGDLGSDLDGVQLPGTHMAIRRSGAVSVMLERPWELGAVTLRAGVGGGVRELWSAYNGEDPQVHQYDTLVHYSGSVRAQALLSGGAPRRLMPVLGLVVELVPASYSTPTRYDDVVYSPEPRLLGRLVLGWSLA